MIRLLPDPRMFARSVWALRLVIPLAVIVGCSTQPQDNANGNQNQNQNQNLNDNGGPSGNTNDNGSLNNPTIGQIFIEFDLGATSAEPFARALSGDDTQFAFYGDTSGGGVPSSITQVDVILPTTPTSASVAVRVTLGEEGKPVSFLGEDEAALLLSYNDEGTSVEVRYVDPSGLTTLETVEIESSTSPSQTSPSAGGICELLDNFQTITDSILSGCAGEPASSLCGGSMARSIDALNSFCSLEVVVVVGTLGAGLGEGLALSVPLGVTVEVDDDEVTPGTDVALFGEVFGGTPPYLYNWAVVEGPSQPTITPSSSGSLSFGSVTLSIVGDYTIRLTVIGNDGKSAFFDSAMTVKEDVGALAVTAGVEGEIEITGSDPFSAIATLVAEVSGGELPHEYEWSLIPGSAPEGATVEFEDPAAASTSVTFSAGGNYILQVMVTDGAGAVATTRPGVTIIDPATSLIAEITFPSCGSSSGEDTCVALNDAIELQASLTNAEASQDQLQYLWTVVQPTGQVTTSSSATVAVSGTTLGTITVRLSVTDPVKSEISMDEITIEVIPSGELIVVIVGETSTILNVPIQLFANVSGAVGLLSYQWEALTSNGGTFDDDTVQSVLFTPEVLGTVEVQVTVTDSAIDTPATATTEISVATFSASIVGDDAITSNSLETYTVSLHDSPPEDLSYAWSIELADENDSLSAEFVDSSENSSAAQILVVGDGSFKLSVMVEEVDNQLNSTTADLDITVDCLSADEPTVDAGAAQVAAAGSEVTLNCMADQMVNRTFRWVSLNDEIDDEDLTGADSATATFTMPSSAPLGFTPLEFECIVTNTATSCDEKDTTIVYAEPMVAPSILFADQTVLVGSPVVVLCEQLSGSTASTYEWRQVDSDGDEIDPPDVDDFNLTAGMLTFTAPSTAQDLFFECRGVINDATAPEGVLRGPYSTDSAVVHSTNFTVTAVAKNGATAPISVPGVTFSQVNVDRVRLSNAGLEGYLVFSSVLSAAGSTGVFGVDLGDPGTVEELVLKGDIVPGGGGELIGVLASFDVQDDNDLAFIATLTDGLGDPTGTVMVMTRDFVTGVFAEVVANGVTDLSPSDKRYCDFDDVAIAGDGTVTFIAQIDTDDDLDCDDESSDSDGVYTTAVTLAEGGSTIIPDSSPSGMFESLFSRLVGNDAGDVIFAGERETLPLVSGAFIMAAGDSTLDSLFLSNNASADTDGVYSVGGGPADLSINSAGVAAYQSAIDGTDATQGIFTNEDVNGTAIVLNGSQSPEGFTFGAFTQLAVNSSGDMVFIAQEGSETKLYYYVAATGSVVVMRDENGTDIMEGRTIDGIFINASNGLVDTEVQINDAGNIVFTANNSSGTAAIFVAQPPNY